MWLFGTAGAVAVMVTVGGMTRLTKSGLSMTDWKLQVRAAVYCSKSCWLQLAHQITPVASDACRPHMQSPTPCNAHTLHGNDQCGVHISQGSLPPRSVAEWEAEFDRYKQFPEYSQRRGMTLDEFKSIYW
jgi:heme A synthase